MKKEYNFSKAKVRKKPVLNAKESKIQTSVRIGKLQERHGLSKEEAEKQHTPYQALLNKYLREAMGKPSVESRLAALEKALFKKVP